jgi:hypothetical protein
MRLALEKHPLIKRYMGKDFWLAIAFGIEGKNH